MASFFAITETYFSDLFGSEHFDDFDKSVGADNIGLGTFRYYFPPEVRLDFSGTGIRYDRPTGLRIPNGGTIDKIVVQLRGPLVDGSRVYYDQWQIEGLKLAIPPGGLDLKSIPELLSGDDFIQGSSFDDELRGYDGNDEIRGLGGDNILYGDGGDDEIFGNDSFDIAKGGDGNDKIYGDDGDDALSGEAGDDFIDGGDEHDEIDGGAGKDTLLGNVGEDFLVGGAKNDRLVGGVGADLIIGGPGGDDLYGAEPAGPRNGDGVRDIFRFLSLGDLTAKVKTSDAIFDFVKGNSPNADRIDLSPIDAIPGGDDQAFKLVKKFKGPGEVRLAKSGKDTIVEFNTDRDKTAEAVLKVVGEKIGEVDLIL